jgi:hypothetical protein
MREPHRALQSVGSDTDPPAVTAHAGEMRSPNPVTVAPMHVCRIAGGPLVLVRPAQPLLIDPPAYLAPTHVRKYQPYRPGMVFLPVQPAGAYT